MSLCIILFECSSLMDWQICLMVEATFASGIDWCFFNCLKSWPPVAASIIKYKFFASSKKPYIFITLGWFKKLWIFNSRICCSVISYSFIKFFYKTFKAQIKFVCLSLTKYTLPYFPVPNYFICSKSSRVKTLYFFLFHESFDHSEVGSLI